MTDLPCTIEYLKQVHVQEVQLGNISDFSGYAEYLPTYARALEHNGIILACYGVILIREGVGEGWAAISDKAVKDHPVSLSRSVRYWLDRIEREENFLRIQTSVAEEHQAGHRWIRWLGFVYEGVMKNYGLGGRGSFVRYARTH